MVQGSGHTNQDKVNSRRLNCSYCGNEFLTIPFGTSLETNELVFHAECPECVNWRETMGLDPSYSRVIMAL